MNKEKLFYEAESKTARSHKYSINYKEKDVIYPTMVIRSQAETIELQEKEIKRLNNIIDEFSRWLVGEQMMFYKSDDGKRLIRFEETENKWLELKEGK